MNRAPGSVDAFRRAWRAHLRTAPMLAFLDRPPFDGCDWTAGGCRFLAGAVIDWLPGARGEVLVRAGREQHAYARVGRWSFDGDVVLPHDAFLAHWIGEMAFDELIRARQERRAPFFVATSSPVAAGITAVPLATITTPATCKDFLDHPEGRPALVAALAARFDAAAVTELLRRS